MKRKPMSQETKNKISKSLSGKNSLKYRHGMSATPFYHRWEAAKRRCNNPNDSRYSSYGGRGIKFHWDLFDDFYRDMYQSYLIHREQYGETATMLERINNDGDYKKENCTWATPKQQQRNRRVNVKYTMTDIIEALDLKPSTVWMRLKRGATLAEALKDPKCKCK